MPAVLAHIKTRADCGVCFWITSHSVNCYKFEPAGAFNFNIERFAVGFRFSAPPGPLLHLVPFILLTTAGLFSDLQNARRQHVQRY